MGLLQRKDFHSWPAQHANSVSNYLEPGGSVVDPSIAGVQDQHRESLPFGHCNGMTMQQALGGKGTVLLTLRIGDHHLLSGGQDKNNGLIGLRHPGEQKAGDKSTLQPHVQYHPTKDKPIPR
ncbi:MAG: hypothetical protein DCE88_10985 [Betaproteobacteria bacterium]|nr:MAG: hypothetical protein DCE88_10985 [Betaproteobacteria bacterium]